MSAVMSGRRSWKSETAEPKSGDASAEDDEEEAAISRAVMEATLLPSVLETFDAIAKKYKSLYKLQQQHLAAAARATSSLTAPESAYAMRFSSNLSF